MGKTLMRVETEGLGSFFVLSDSMDKAAEKVKNLLDKNDYGFSSKRKVKSVTIITKMIMADTNGKVKISDDTRFLLIGHD